MAVTIDNISLAMQFCFEMYLLGFFLSQNVVFSLDEIFDHIKLSTADSIHTFDERKVSLNKNLFTFMQNQFNCICFLVSESLNARELKFILFILFQRFKFYFFMFLSFIYFSLFHLLI